MPPRTAVDLAVPRSPMMSTPPMLGSTTVSSSASFISSWPAILVNGKVGFLVVLGAAVAASALTTTTLPRERDARQACCSVLRARRRAGARLTLFPIIFKKRAWKNVQANAEQLRYLDNCGRTAGRRA